MATKTCVVSLKTTNGIKSSVEITAKSLYEAAILGLSLLKKDDWIDVISPGTRLEVQIRQPAAVHELSVAQLQRWCDGVVRSPEELIRKKRLKELLEG